ncbi:MULTISPECIES: agmatine deiminase family protein [Sulfurimonas]|uniref:agmatine deiminase family protein n=1 Tax=Sulfurimonas TaxID=202746 RepID=UPI0012643530|nr:agmatine deiminase family protein [Sulfurimonas indica]
MFEKKRLIAEFEEQGFTQIIFPHAQTDWAPYLREAQNCFIDIINTIKEFQNCLVICADKEATQKHFASHKNLFFTEYATDDTWARDCSTLCVRENGKTELLDFTFNAWGEKFEADRDNAMSQTIKDIYTLPVQKLDFVLEGGAVESNGKDTVLTTAACMLNPNRNPKLNNIQITQNLKEYFGAEHILYLNHGYLAGDDTDSHIDTLARFINEDTIMYVQCRDKADEHYKELHLMEEELSMIAKERGLKLIALPMPDALYYEEERLPATYANFLFVNGAVLVPLYNVAQDREALEVFKKTFPKREVIGIDCSTLIRQHGSLHCVTMNFAKSVGLQVSLFF